MFAKFCQCGQVNVQIITREEIRSVFRKKKRRKASLVKLAHNVGGGARGGRLLGTLSGNLLPSNKIWRGKTPKWLAAAIQTSRDHKRTWGRKRDPLAVWLKKMGGVIVTSPIGLWLPVHKPWDSVRWLEHVGAWEQHVPQYPPSCRQDDHRWLLDCSQRNNLMVNVFTLELD